MNYTVKMSEEAENNLKAVIEYISIKNATCGIKFIL